MTWFDKQARARRRAEQDRNALAASVEEVVAESMLVGDEWHDANEEQEVLECASTSGTAIIPPLLRLQTRPIPAVNSIQAPKPLRSDLTTTGPVEIPYVTQQGQRLAGRSTRVHLQAVRAELPGEISTERMATIEKVPLESQTGSMPRIEPVRLTAPFPASGQTGSMPRLTPIEGQTGSIPRVVPASQHRPTSPFPATGQPGSMSRLMPLEGQTGSIQKVGPVDRSRPLSPSASAGQSRTTSSTVPKRNGSTPASSAEPPQQNLRLPGGSGVIKQGQNVVTVPNAAITERSVVTVMLTGNPGPVVVQYVALHPRMGFTVHLSAPTAASTPFNYLIWPF